MNVCAHGKDLAGYCGVCLPVKVIDGDDGSERDCPDLVTNGSPDYAETPATTADDQMWSPRNGDVYPIVRTMPVGVRPGVAIEFGDGVSRLFEDAELDRLRDQLVGLRGLPTSIRAAIEAADKALEGATASILRLAAQQAKDQSIVWTAEPPECDSWWWRHLHPNQPATPVRAEDLAESRLYWESKGTSGDRFAPIPGGIPRGPKS